MSSKPLRLPDFASSTPDRMADDVLERLAQHRQAVTEALAHPNPTFTTLVLPQERAEHATAMAWAPLAQLAATCDSPQVRAAYDRVVPHLIELNAWVLNQDALYEGLCIVRDTEALDGWQAAVVRHSLRAFERRGVGLSDPTKARLASIDQGLSAAGVRFGRNVQDTTNAWHLTLSEAQTHGMPESAMALLRQAGAQRSSPTGLAATLQIPVVLAVLAHCSDRDVRRVLHDAHNTRCTSEGVGGEDRRNDPIVLSMLALRHEKAQTVGQKDYAHLALEEAMAQGPGPAVELLHRLRDRVRDAARAEWDALAQFASTELGIDGMRAYDLAFVSERHRQALFEVADETVKRYFPYPEVMAGVLDVAGRLFGVSFQRQRQGSTWHEDVEFYTVHDGERLIAGFYIDPFARPGKKNGAWASAMVRKLEDDVLPVSSLNCNFAAPAEGRPALLTHQDVVTLFHEFGHGLHLMLGTSPYPSVDMSAVERDAIEGPSQLMENFAWDKTTLLSFARHVDTGETIPEALIDKLHRAQRHNGALAMVRQLTFGLTDLALHQGTPVSSEAELWAVQEAVRAQAHVPNARPEAGDRSLAAFAHLFQGGYASAYYSYLWAEVLSADAFEAFSNPDGELDVEVGKKWREEVLAVGGRRPFMASFEAFRGRAPDPQALMTAKGLVAPKRQTLSP